MSNPIKVGIIWKQPNNLKLNLKDPRGVIAGVRLWSKRVLITLLHLLSDLYPKEKYEPPYLPVWVWAALLLLFYKKDFGIKLPTNVDILLNKETNCYRRRKGTWRHEFKSRTWLIPFHIALIPLGKVWIQSFFLQISVNSWADWFFTLDKASSLGERKFWIQTC